MALVVNGTTIPTNKHFAVNGTSVTKVVANGKTVWQYVAPSTPPTWSTPVRVKGQKEVSILQSTTKFVWDGKTVYTRQSRMNMGDTISTGGYTYKIGNNDETIDALNNYYKISRIKL